MPILNENLHWSRVDLAVRRAFEHTMAMKFLFPTGTELFKFTAFGLYPTDRHGQGAVGQPISPWWCTVHPTLGPDDLGLDGLLAAAKAAGVSAAEFVRQNLAVMYQWNSLSHNQLGLGRAQRIRLLQPVYGFYGRTAPQRNDRYPTLRNPVAATPGWIRGGAIQVWMPNLTGGVFIGTGCDLVA